MFIDLHTHSIRTQQNLTSVFSAPPVTTIDNLPNNWLVSTGIHPWLCDKENLTQTCQDLQATSFDELTPDVASAHSKMIKRWLDELAKLAAERKIDAMGETGLDRIRGGNLSGQITVFEQQLQIAEQHELPVVIHCVRAFPELLAVRKRFHQTPWIIHGFNGNIEIATQLRNHNCHISFGMSLLRTPKLQTVARKLTAKHFFLETDQSEAPIENLYQATAQILCMDEKMLRDQIANHFNEVFPR